MGPDFDSIDDDRLVAAVAEGSAEALTALFRRRQAHVYRFAMHMTGSAAMAEDVTQDVFLVVMRDAARYQPGRSAVAAWLCGIARNCARQRLDREPRRTAPLEPDTADDVGVPAVECDPLSDLARARSLMLLRRAVLALPVRYREVVVLCDLQELTYAEAADALGCAIGTVRSRLHRARTLLAAKVAALEGRKGPVASKDASEGPAASRTRLAGGESAFAGGTPGKCLA